LKETQDHVIINNLSYDLEALEKDCWTRLVNGANRNRDSFHTPCISFEEPHLFLSKNLISMIRYKFLFRCMVHNKSCLRSNLRQWIQKVKKLPLTSKLNLNSALVY